MSGLLDEKMAAAGVTLLYLTRVVDVMQEGGRITHLVLHNKSGFSAVPATLVVDATGDADVAVLSGCETVIGRKQDRLMTPVTLQVHMDGIDQEALAEYINRNDSPRFLTEIEKLRAKGEWPFIYERFITVQMTEPGTMMVNTPRITGIDGTDGASVTKGMIQGRREILQLLEVMRKHFPGCANARLRSVAPLLGVRETRRIVGDFRFTVQDVVERREVPDIIGFTAYGWDLPDPIKPSHQPMTQAPNKRIAITPIPYRVLLPRPVRNLICPGRAISVERHVLDPLREQAPCMAMGQAARNRGLAGACRRRGSPTWRCRRCANACATRAPSSTTTKPGMTTPETGSEGSRRCPDCCPAAPELRSHGMCDPASAGSFRAPGSAWLRVTPGSGARRFRCRHPVGSRGRRCSGELLGRHPAG